jgi:hypothetical protein
MEKKMGKSIELLINILLICVLLSIGYLAYIILEAKGLINFKLPNNLETSKSQLQEISNTTQYKGNRIDELHKKIYYQIMDANLNSEKISLKSTHPDYKDIMKLLAKGESLKKHPIKMNFRGDKYILQTFSSEYKVSLKNIYNHKYNFEKEASDKKFLFTFTGAYTSSFKRPVGIFSVDGKILNPAIRNWDGLLLVKDGVAQIIDARNINIGFKKLNVLNSIKDLRTFFRWIRENDLSILQSHMIVNNGKIAVKNIKSRLFSRRAIFEDEDGTLHVYDSQEKKMSLFKLSEILVNKYKAIKAINLDVGTYDYAYKHIDGTTSKLGLLDKVDLLSNIIEIEKR